VSDPFIDSNIFLRHLTADHPQQSPACLALFKAIEQGQVTAWTTDLTIAEVVWVLFRIYKLTQEEIRDALVPLIGLPGLKLPRKRLYHRVFELFTTLRIDYIDCYHAALMEATQQCTLYSYDHDFDRVPTLTRQEP
jgi:predicted nucleic acid-binding protein